MDLGVSKNEGTVQFMAMCNMWQYMAIFIGTIKMINHGKKWVPPFQINHDKPIWMCTIIVGNWKIISEI
jgi:hypothetical protein